ncbi:MAG: AmmeMemoRadiSam system protein B [Candidatus Omnitrophota bacterium]|nr:AmmeMemoRadiSam system protein B [Candidatus Omnitrophota bacterium]
MKIRYITSILLFVIFAITAAAAAETKEADLAGSWYPASKTQLESQLKSYLDAAKTEEIDGKILAIIVPHAGYDYSGPVAAYGYKAVENTGIKTVIILGFSHRKYLDGVSVYGGDSWRTPLGEVAVDTAIAGKIISSNPRFRFQKELFEEENSVEMQVPFVQMALGEKGTVPFGDSPLFPKIVPIAFGSRNYSDAQALAKVIADLIKDRSDCLIAASTDLSHYHSYQEANSIDNHTIQLLDKLNAKELYEEAKMGVCEICGMMPVVTSLLVAETLGYGKIKTLKYANSGDITGDKAKVVGYVSAVIYKDEIASAASRPRNDVAQKVESNMLNDVQRKRLLQIARESITSYVRDGKRKSFIEKDLVLNQPMGAFVTLHEAGELRGCIGNMAGQGPLYKTIADMAIEAATGDPRFQKLSTAEIDKIVLEISVLSPLQRVKSADEIKIPGHGVIVKSGFNSGVYLPQVATETEWSKEEFLTSLCAQKAGLKPDAWKNPSTEIYIFTAEVFGEGGK